MRRFLSILASLSRFATLAVALMLACLAPQAEALLTPSDPVLSAPIPSQAHAPESILIIEEIHPVGYADDGECLDLCVCVEPETHTRVFCIVKSPTGLVPGGGNPITMGPGQDYYPRSGDWSSLLAGFEHRELSQLDAVRMSPEITARGTWALTDHFVIRTEHFLANKGYYDAT